MVAFLSVVQYDQQLSSKRNTRSRIDFNYRKIIIIRRTISHHLNDSRLVLQLSLPNPLKPGVKSIMKM